MICQPHYSGVATTREDNDIVDDTATLTFTLTGGGFSNSPITTTLDVTITDRGPSREPFKSPRREP